MEDNCNDALQQQIIEQELINTREAKKRAPSYVYVFRDIPECFKETSIFEAHKKNINQNSLCMFSLDQNKILILKKPRLTTSSYSERIHSCEHPETGEHVLVVMLAENTYSSTNIKTFNMHPINKLKFAEMTVPKDEVFENRPAPAYSYIFRNIYECFQDVPKVENDINENSICMFLVDRNDLLKITKIRRLKDGERIYNCRHPKTGMQISAIGSDFKHWDNKIILTKGNVLKFDYIIPKQQEKSLCSIF